MRGRGRTGSKCKIQSSLKVSRVKITQIFPGWKECFGKFLILRPHLQTDLSIKFGLVWDITVIFVNFYFLTLSKDPHVTGNDQFEDSFGKFDITHPGSGEDRVRKFRIWFDLNFWKIPNRTLAKTFTWPSSACYMVLPRDTSEWVN